MRNHSKIILGGKCTMREVTMKVYTVEELSERALSRAHYDWYMNSDYPWDRENEKTLLEFERVFPIEVTDWQYGGVYKYVRFHMTCEDEVADLEGVRLAKYIWNNYRHSIYKGKYYSKGKFIDGKYQYVSRRSKLILEKDYNLTGYYIDYDILKPIWDFLDSPRPNITFKDLMKECLDEWLEACEDDYNNYYSLDNFIEIAKVNKWEFYEDGSMF
jgi:hypothetical protein